MRTLLIVILLVSTLEISAQTHVDTALYVIFPYGNANGMMGWPQPNAKPTALTRHDVDALEGLIQAEYKARSLDTSFFKKWPIWSQYRRQYVAMISGKGEKLVWINFLCQTANLDWRHHFYIVEDGGNCFMQMLVNWSKRKVVNFATNGVAYNNSSG